MDSKIRDGVFTTLAVAHELATIFAFVGLGFLAVEAARLVGSYDYLIRLALRGMVAL